MNDKFLPIGTVVILKKGKKKLMITGYCPMDLNDNKKIYDFSGCFYPEGILDSSNFLFNYDQIEKIYFKGYADEEYVQFIGKLKEIIEKNSQ